jgi:hypothetical protein
MGVGVKKRATPSTARITEAIVSRTAQISNRNTSRAARRDNAKAKGATNIFSSISVYKTFTNLPNGTYQFSIWAKTNGDQDVLQLYAKNYGGDELTTTITTSDINWNIFTIDEIVVTNNTLEIGVYTVAGADDWCNLDMAILRKVE